MRAFGILAVATLATSCSDMRASHSKIHEGFDASNSPGRMQRPGVELNGYLAQLPTSATLSGWISADIYHFSENGTAKRTGSELSPIEKYDAAFNPGKNNPATKWERIYHGAQNGPVESWFGHCHAVAASASVENEPARNVIVNKITFTPQDVKALLAEAYFISHEQVAGKRCESSATQVDASGRLVDENCRDLNPAAFHVTLANYLGRDGLKPVLDIDASFKVWSATVRAYSSTVSPITLDAAAKLFGKLKYDFNPDATSLAKVHTKVTAMLRGEIVREYEYILELDSDGFIIGGEWLGESRKNHPDFIWYPGNPEAENPYVDTATILDIARQSAVQGISSRN